MGIETVSLIIAAFVNGAVGTAALMRNFRSRLCVAFATFAGLLFIHDALSVLETFDEGAGYASPRFHLYITLLLGPIALWLLGEIAPVFRKRIRRLINAYLPVLVLAIVALYLPGHERFDRVALIAVHALFLLPAAAWVIFLHRAQERSTLTRERVRLKYAFGVGAFTIAAFVTDAMTFAGYSVAPLGTLARTLYLIFIFQTFVQKELMTAEEVVAKVTLMGGVALTLSIIYSLLVSWVGDKRDLFFFNTFIASFVIIVLFDPIRQLTLRLTRRLLLRGNLMLEQELNALSTDVMGIVEPAELARRIDSALRRALGVEGSSLYLLERDGLSYLRVGGGKERVQELPVSSPLVEYMSLRRGRPFVSETIENDRDSFHSLQPRKFCETCLQGMRALGADLIVPFLLEAQPIGFFAVKTGERAMLTNEQMRLFIPVSRQIALLLKNAQTFTFLSDRAKLAAVGEMAAGLAHEIKNPLGAIKGAAELLKESKRESDRGDEFLNIILDETRRLSGVLTDFLDYARPRRNQPETSCDPLRVIEHTLPLVLRDSKVNVEIATEREGITLEADPEILKQVLLNLFLNAVQAMEGFASQPSLKVSVRERKRRISLPFLDSLPLVKVWEGWQRTFDPRAADSLEIEIADNGVGIPPEDLPRIFMPFYTTKAKGTGLGLAISQRLVESMGGNLSVKANKPQGAIFIVALPMRRPNLDPVSGSPFGKEVMSKGTGAP